MAKEGSFVWTLIKFVITFAILGAVAYGVLTIVKGIQDGISQTKENMGKKGYNLSSSGMSVKTNQRAMTTEETQDRIQSSIMKGWKSSSFEVPWILQKGTNLGGSRHDKKKEDWEKKYGPKKHTHVE